MRHKSSEAEHSLEPEAEIFVHKMVKDPMNFPCRSPSYVLARIDIRAGIENVQNVGTHSYCLVAKSVFTF